jgi:hypothetical protein
MGQSHQATRVASQTICETMACQGCVMGSHVGDVLQVVHGEPNFCENYDAPAGVRAPQIMMRRRDAARPQLARKWVLRGPTSGRPQGRTPAMKYLDPRECDRNSPSISANTLTSTEPEIGNSHAYNSCDPANSSANVPDGLAVETPGRDARLNLAKSNSDLSIRSEDTRWGREPRCRRGECRRSGGGDADEEAEAEHVWKRDVC